LPCDVFAGSAGILPALSAKRENRRLKLGASDFHDSLFAFRKTLQAGRLRSGDAKSVF